MKIGHYKGYAFARSFDIYINGSVASLTPAGDDVSPFNAQQPGLIVQLDKRNRVVTSVLSMEAHLIEWCADCLPDPGNPYTNRIGYGSNDGGLNWEHIHRLCQVFEQVKEAALKPVTAKVKVSQAAYGIKKF